MPAFVIAVKKAQSQTFQFVGVDIKMIFIHGMLSVAFIRVKSPNALKVRLPEENHRRSGNLVCR